MTKENTRLRSQVRIPPKNSSTRQESVVQTEETYGNGAIRERIIEVVKEIVVERPFEVIVEKIVEKEKPVEVIKEVIKEKILVEVDEKDV